MLLAQTFPCQILTGFATANPSFSAAWWTVETGKLLKSKILYLPKYPLRSFSSELAFPVGCVQMCFQPWASLTKISILRYFNPVGVLLSCLVAHAIYLTRQLVVKCLWVDKRKKHPPGASQWQEKLPVFVWLGERELGCYCLVTLSKNKLSSAFAEDWGKSSWTSQQSYAFCAAGQSGDAFLWAVTLVTTLQRWYVYMILYDTITHLITVYTVCKYLYCILYMIYIWLRNIILLI